MISDFLNVYISILNSNVKYNNNNNNKIILTFYIIVKYNNTYKIINN